MTVAELIALLQKCSPDAPVLMPDHMHVQSVTELFDYVGNAVILSDSED